MALSWLRFRYRPVLVVLLLPSLLLIGMFSYYPALRSLIGGFYRGTGSPRRSTPGISQFTQYVQSPRSAPRRRTSPSWSAAAS